MHLTVYLSLIVYLYPIDQRVAHLLLALYNSLSRPSIQSTKIQLAHLHTIVQFIGLLTYMCIYIYSIVILYICLSLFESTLLNFICANHYSVGPSNTSQWQHRRKEATEQIKKPALAGSRTQVSATLGPRAYRYATGAVT